jgi:hypothetical protein
MSQGSGLPSFNRQDLRKATKFVEGDYNGINPRSFYRKLKRGIEEIQNDYGFKYHVEGNQEQDLDISSEEVGQKTGVVKGRLRATSDWAKIGNGALEYRPYGPHGALAVVLGIVLLVVGFSGEQMALAGGGVLVGLAGLYGYTQKERDTFPIIRQDMIRTLMTGEVSERTTEAGNQTRTDIFANMSVVFAGDSFVAVDTGELETLDWTFRRELTNQVRRWNNQVVASAEEKVPVEDGFMWQLKGWLDRSTQSHRGTIEGFQTKLVRQAPFHYRMRYTTLLEEQLGPEMQDRLDGHRRDLMAELEELAEDIDVFVEREGLQHTSEVTNSSANEDPQLNPDVDDQHHSNAGSRQDPNASSQQNPQLDSDSDGRHH